MFFIRSFLKQNRFRFLHPHIPIACANLFWCLCGRGVGVGAGVELFCGILWGQL